jgi:hypothetical protein
MKATYVDEKRVRNVEQLRQRSVRQIDVALQQTTTQSRK